MPDARRAPRKPSAKTLTLLLVAVLASAAGSSEARADVAPKAGAPPGGEIAASTTGVWPDIGIPVQMPTQASADAALVVGIEKYDALPAVAGAAENAREWEKYFLFGRRIPPERVKLLVDQAATHEAIAARVAELTARVSENGVLWIVFIGHGAPGEGDAKGLLLGADARPSDASFASRSVSFDALRELSAKGTQARTVMVLDACFSGVSNEGKTLLPSVQPVIATKLLSTAKTTVITAASSAEYAGALPGSQRPALSYLVLGGLRGWADDNADGKVTAAEAHAYASLVMRSMPNNHEQHPELVTDAPDDVLEPEAREKAPDLAVMRSRVSAYKAPVEAKDEPAEIRVAAGCRAPGVLTPDDGLLVFFDGATESASPLGVRKRVVDGREEPAFVPFVVAPGPHRVRVRLPGCDELEATVTVRRAGSAVVSGLLPPSGPFFNGSPAGSPNGLRLGVGLQTSILEVGGFEKLVTRTETTLGTPPVPTVALTGLGVHGGLQLRWLTALVDLQASFGGTKGTLDTVKGDGVVTRVDPVNNGVSLTMLTAGARLGARIPFEYAALSFGPGASLGVVHASPEVGEGSTGLIVRKSLWAAVDVQPFCDYGLQAGYAHGFTELSNADVRSDNALFLNVAWQPNAVCQRRRDGAYKLEGN